ncbi:hypothetical protein SSX86_008050 [Deinandra increscens subsp. villosa]|uniref:Uncharacterized protein n=1 Tax=Deinandra increscens subsp. villosa TaxID=3103831 RepID=A0AAP0DAJ7_9ASTR
MESQLQHTHGRHYDDAGVPHTGEDEHHGEKKSVMKKVKEKAKKIKNTITKHGHGHDHHHHDDEDDDDEDDDDDDEAVMDAEVHGAPMYDSARVGQVGLDASLPQLPRGNLERPSVIAEDRYPEPVASRGVPPPASTGAYGTNLFEPSSGLGHDSREINPEKWRGKIGQSTGMEEEEPFAPNPTRMSTPIDPTYGMGLVPDPVVNLGGGQDVNRGGLKGVIGKETTMVPDPHAPKDPLSMRSDPSNYATKVDNPTHTGGKEAELSQLQHSFDKMGIDSGPKTFDPNHPENLPRETLTGNPSSQSSSYADKISSSASAIADKAVAAKDVIASKLGYSSQNPSTESTGSHDNPGSTTSDYAHTITDKVTGTLAPVYEKVVDAGSSVVSKVQGSVSGTGQPQVHGGSENVTDKGVSVKENLMETLRPGDGDKALSDAITNALHRGKQEESGRKSGEDKPMGIVTESVEVRRRLGTDRQEEHNRDSGGGVVADKGVTERLRDAMGSWFGGKGDAPQGTLGTSYVTDEGLSSNPTGTGTGTGTGDRKGGSGRGR